MAVISVRDLSFSYNKKTTVLKDVSFEIEKNDFVGIIGPNGGGKSTLLKILLGLLRPNKGKVLIFGNDPDSARDKIGYVPQYNKIDLDYPITVKEVLLSGFLGRKKIGSRFSNSEKQRALNILEELKLNNLKNKIIGQLSGGQRQRVFIARALVRQPKLLLLDEPTNSVDKASGRDLYDLLHELNKNMTIIIVSHDLGIISKHVNKIFCLNRKIVCNEANQITQKNSGQKMRKVYHDENCIIH